MSVIVDCEGDKKDLDERREISNCEARSRAGYGDTP